MWRARHEAKADSGTWGPQSGSNPLALVLALCSAALSHSSRALDDLCGDYTMQIISLNARVISQVTHDIS